MKSVVSKLIVWANLFFKDRYRFLAKLLTKHPINRVLPDQLHISLCYRGFVGQWMDWKNPKTFNEKLQWLKLFDRHDWYWDVCDKVEVRKFVADRAGVQYLIPLIGVYNSVDEIKFENLPKQFVLKCTHDSGSTVLCPDKSQLNIPATKARLRKKLRRNYFFANREYQYKGVRPRILCEEYISLGNNLEPNDYKFLCFDGVPKFIQVDVGRYTDHRRVIMDTSWARAPFDLDPRYSSPDYEINRPPKLDEMLDIAARLSLGLKFVRVDLYAENDKIYFGELTFAQGAGYDPVLPEEAKYSLGELIHIDNLSSNQEPPGHFKNSS